jgi:hypothetical protein
MFASGLSVTGMPASVGQKAMAASLPVTIASDQAVEGHIGEVGGHINKVTKEITRAASADTYHANDLMADSAGVKIWELPNVGRIVGGTQYLVGLRLTTNLKSITPRFRVHFFNAATPTLSADNANWQDKYADVLLRTGYVDLPAMSTAADATNSDMSRSMDLTLRYPMCCSAISASMWFAFEALDSFVSASGQKFTLITLWDNN